MNFKIGNAGKTVVFLFYMSHNYTINFKGEKQVAMQTTDYEKLHVTVMLCITAHGNTLPPHTILNKKLCQKKSLQSYNSFGKKMHGCQS